MNFWLLGMTAALAAGGAASAADAPVTLTVETNQVLRRGADKFVGINLNYIRDADANRPRARRLDDAMKDMGVRWLRYPGGEKSDFHLWASPPYDKAHSVSLSAYANYAGARLDFDAFVSHARAVRAEPYVVVGFDSEARTGRTKAQWLENAVSWVRYANKTKKYGVKYWEIGNENWHNGTAKPEEMAQVVAEFSRAMKAVDPTIHLGASGNNDDWWRKFLPTAAPHLDFVSLSLYNTWEWKGYAHFVQNPRENLIRGAEEAAAAIGKFAPPADRARLKVVVAETNSKDYSEGGWPGDNTLGHALVTFETLGRLMASPQFLSAMVWTTRWMDDGEAKRSQWYALGPDNELLPTGWAIALWGRAIQPNMLAVSGGNDWVSAYAARSDDGKKISVWIVNRGDRAADVRVRITSPVASNTAVVHRLSGSGPDDPAPHWETLTPAPAVAENVVSTFPCPGVSVSVVTLDAGRNH